MIEPQLNTSESRLKRNLAKIRRENLHFKYLIETKGLHSLEIADRMIHEMFTVMRIGLKNKFPNASSLEIRKKMIEIVERDRKLKSLRRTRQGIR
jgi:hypothetical protein